MTLEPLEQPVLRPRYRRGTRTVEFDIHAALHTVRNGLQVPVTLDDSVNREERYQIWLSKVGGVGTRPEFMVFESLERFGLHAPESEQPGFDFEFQVPLNGGRGQKGGSVLDFLVHALSPPVCVRVQGEFWHYIDATVREADEIEKIAIQNRGFKVVDVLAQDTTSEGRTDFVVGLALKGLQVDPAGRLGVFK